MPKQLHVAIVTSENPRTIERDVAARIRELTAERFLLEIDRVDYSELPISNKSYPASHRMQALIVYRDEGSAADATAAGEASEHAMEDGHTNVPGGRRDTSRDEGVDTMACTSADGHQGELPMVNPER
jgi:hypothetical protein